MALILGLNEIAASRFVWNAFETQVTNETRFGTGADYVRALSKCVSDINNARRLVNVISLKHCKIFSSFVPRQIKKISQFEHSCFYLCYRMDHDSPCRMCSGLVLRTSRVGSHIYYRVLHEVRRDYHTST